MQIFLTTRLDTLCIISHEVSKLTQVDIYDESVPTLPSRTIYNGTFPSQYACLPYVPRLPRSWLPRVNYAEHYDYCDSWDSYYFNASTNTTSSSDDKEKDKASAKISNYTERTVEENEPKTAVPGYLHGEELMDPSFYASTAEGSFIYTDEAILQECRGYY